MKMEMKSNRNRPEMTRHEQQTFAEVQNRRITVDSMERNHWVCPHLTRDKGEDLTWSPHSLITGMLMSSTNTVSFLPAGGPYVVPILLST